MSKGELQPNVSPFDALASFTPRFWLYIIITGIVAGVSGGLLMKLLYAIQEWTWSYTTGTFLEGVEKSSYGWRVIALLCVGVLVAAGRWLLQQTTGGHAGGVSEAIWFESGRLPILKTYCNSVLSICVVGMGASMGREGAMKQAGAGIASWLTQHGSLPLSQRRLLVACGVGAGAAVAYNVPLGGALFAVEVLLGDLSLPLVVPALVASFIATGVSWLILPNQPTYQISQYEISTSLMVWTLIAGPLLGLASVVYTRVIAWADRRKPKGLLMLVAPVLVLTTLGCVAIPLPQLLGNGKDLAQLTLASETPILLLLILPFLKMAVTAACLGCGTPGGLFTPIVTYGALLGGLLGWVWNLAWPGGETGCYALVGATAILAATTQGPLSSMVMMSELTRRLDALMVPVLTAVATAELVARAIDARSVYSARIHLGRAVLGLAPPPHVATHFNQPLSTAFEVITSAARYTEVMHRLLALETRNEPLYVMDENGRLVGELDAMHASTTPNLAVPMQLATASDLAFPVETLSSSMTSDEVERQLRASGRTRLPVFDATSGRVIGVVNAALSGKGKEGDEIEALPQAGGKSSSPKR